MFSANIVFFLGHPGVFPAIYYFMHSLIASLAVYAPVTPTYSYSFLRFTKLLLDPTLHSAHLQAQNGHVAISQWHKAPYNVPRQFQAGLKYV